MRSRRAFTMVELVVVIAVIGILIAVLIPAVNAAREAARRAKCQNNLRQLSLAVINYASAHSEHLPALVRDVRRRRTEISVSHSVGFSWRTSVLPYLEEQGLFDQLDFDKWPEEPENHAAIKTIVPVFQCPSTPGSPRRIMTWDRGEWDPVSGEFLDPVVPAGANDYHALSHVSAPQGSTFFFGTDFGVGAWAPRRITSRGQYQELAERNRRQGTTVYSRRARLAQIKDGLSNTLLLMERGGYDDVLCAFCGDVFRLATWVSAESVHSLDYDDEFRLPDVSWMSGDPHGPISYPHPHIAMCDGSVRTCAKDVDNRVLWALVTRSRDEVIDADW